MKIKSPRYFVWEGDIVNGTICRYRVVLPDGKVDYYSRKGGDMYRAGPSVYDLDYLIQYLKEIPEQELVLLL